MMRKGLSIFLIVFLGMVSIAQAQITEKGYAPLYLERHQVSFNLLAPSLQYEIGLFRNVTASAILGLGLATPQEGYSLSPMYNAKARFYHNLGHRKRMGKNVSGNSGNYLAASYSHFFTKWELLGNMDNGDSSLDFMGAVYGLQRTYENGLNFSVEAGAGWYIRDGRDQGMGPVVGFSLGWSPRGKKQKSNRGLPPK